MRVLLVTVSALLLFALPVLANQSVDNDNGARLRIDAPSGAPVYTPSRDLLFDNGEIVSNPAYPTYSIRQDLTLGSTTNGYGHQFQSDIRISDDFTIPVGEEWLIETITFYAYQSSSGYPASTITSVVVEILDGPPDDPLSNVVYGDLITNTLDTTTFSGIFRTPESSLPGYLDNRPLMTNVCNVPVQLGPGQYWLVWMSDGTTTSGPWVPPVCIWDDPNTGDAWQYYTSAWTQINDAGDGGMKGIPFVIHGTVASAVEGSTWGEIKAMFK